MPVKTKSIHNSFLIVYTKVIFLLHGLDAHMPQTPAQTPARWLVLAAFAAIYTIWGSSYIAIHFAVETIPPFLMMGGRLFAAGVALMIMAWRTGAPKPTRSNWRSAATAAFFMFMLNAGAIAYSEAKLGMPSGVAAVLLATMPLWIVLISWLRPGGTAPTPLVVVGIVLGFLGIWLLSSPGDIPLNPLGVVVILGAALCWAIGSMYARTADLPASAPQATGMQLMCGGFGLIMVSILSGELAAFNPAQVTATSLGAMIYLAIFNSFTGFSAFVWLMRVSIPSRVATYAYVNPVIAVILGALLANEILTSRSLLAGAIILLSVFLITVQRLPFMERLTGRLRLTKAVG